MMNDMTRPTRSEFERWDRYRDAIEHVGDGYFVLGRDLRLVEVNDPLCAMLGYERRELLGRSPLDFVTEDSRVKMRQQLERIDSTETRRNRYEARRRDGSVLPILVRSITHRAADGAVESSVGFVTDLSEIVQAQEALAASEREQRAILDSMQDTYYRTDRNGVVLRASKSLERLLGWSEEDVLGLRMADYYVDPADRDRFLHALSANGGSVRQYEAPMRHRDGREVWVSTNAQYYFDAAGQLAGVEGVARDNTAARLAREELRLAAQVFHCAAEAIVIVDRKWQVISVNPAFVELTGFDPAHAMGRPVFDFVAASTDETRETIMRELERESRWQGEAGTRRRDAAPFASWISAGVVRDDHGRVTQYLMLFSDITERKAAQARVEFLAHHDPLTHLPNRLLLRDRVAQGIAHAQRTQSRLVMLFVDLNDFKNVNDAHGHEIGDRVLREIAQRLPGCLRDTDTVGRFGGDEFVAVLTDVGDLSLVDRLSGKIAACVEEPILVDDRRLGVSCSIGVAVWPDDGTDFGALLARADAAMYEAKRTR